MGFWIKEINLKKFFLSGILFTVVATVIHQIEAFLTMKYYLMPEYFGVWSKLMMPKAGPPPAEFFITSLVFSLVTGLGITAIYYYLRGHLPENKTKRIFYFADLMVGTSFLFSTLPIYLMLNVPTGLLISWFISNFIIMTIASWIIVKIVK